MQQVQRAVRAKAQPKALRVAVGIVRIGASSEGAVIEAHAPAAGVILYICAVPTMKKDDTIANVGEITTNP